MFSNDERGAISQCGCERRVVQKVPSIGKLLKKMRPNPLYFASFHNCNVHGVQFLPSNQKPLIMRVLPLKNVLHEP